MSPGTREGSVKQLDVNGLQMKTVTAGTGPVVLLCHGFPETHHSWRKQMQPLADAGFRAVAPDLRGFGGTQGPQGVDHYGMMELVGDVVGILDALEAKDAIIVGNDWGATLAWQAALMRPDRFRSVVAVGVPMMDRSPAPPTTMFPANEDAEFYIKYFQRAGEAEAELDADVRTSLLKIMFAASGDAGPREPGDETPNPFGMIQHAGGLLGPLPAPDTLPPWLEEWDFEAFTSAFQASGFRGGLNFYRNMDRNWRDQAALAGLKVTVPALYMVGERDTGLAIPGMGEIIEAMPKLVPNLQESVRFPGAGHWLPQERPEAFNARLIQFFRDVL